MILSRLLVVFGYLLPSLVAYPSHQWPNGPLHTEGRWIRDASGNKVHFAGTNWPGHGEVMIPEGLQYQSVKQIMIDQLYDNGGKDIDLKTAFVKGLGEKNGTRVLKQVLQNNPSFTRHTTRLEVYDAVTAELAKSEIHILLDNHMSTGKWCCSGEDGNGWWGDREFNVKKWLRGLNYMAKHGRKWKALVAISPRNELRQPTDNPKVLETYNWQTYYKYIRQGADAIHAGNRDVLIYLSGMGYGAFLEPIFRQTPLEPGKEIFDKKDFVGYGDKLVLDIHNYERTITCPELRDHLYTRGFQAMNASDPDTKEVFPVQITEFGRQLNDTTWTETFSTCLAEYLPEVKAGWFVWVLVGSYYARRGLQNDTELWGLLRHDWKEWRNPAYIEKQLKPMVKRTLRD
ncbi:hypothetical protein FSARC_4270 [Fusarium sarcochroum]|uniref:Glycoside hydrolase family 5 domain-containing protein n=1 Tax=Fusarium sarcochroum TaxID=1208366 RepID=A0A8H4U263_9HYPO|nr:hypothetical protein FSARC_4270 [Fusarium sarcochroum]